MEMRSDPDEYAITPSTAFLGISALVTIRDNEHELYDSASVEFAEYVLKIIKHQPDTVLNLKPNELEAIGRTLIENSPAWLG